MQSDGREKVVAASREGLAIDGSDRPAHSMILGVLGAAQAPMSRGDLAKRLKTKAATEAGLTTATIPEELEILRRNGLIVSERVKRTIVFELTDSGRDYLRKHPAPAVSAGRGRVNPPTNDDVLRGRQAELLLQLLEANDYTLTANEANKRLRRRDSLELNAATANAERQRLADEGCLEISGSGRLARFRLTPAGRLRLGAMTFYGTFKFRLRGKVLNDLLDAAREAAKEFSEDSDSHVATFDRADVERTIHDAFDELLRERYAVHGMVPIHEIRAAVRRKYGDAAARHDLFDTVLLEMRRRMHWRMIPISDRSRATAEELQDSVHGVGETLFYLEAERDTVAR